MSLRGHARLDLDQEAMKWFGNPSEDFGFLPTLANTHYLKGIMSTPD